MKLLSLFSLFQHETQLAEGKDSKLSKAEKRMAQRLYEKAKQDGNLQYRRNSYANFYPKVMAPAVHFRFEIDIVSLRYSWRFYGPFRCTGLKRFIVGCIGLKWAVMGCNGFRWVEMGCSGLLWVAMDSKGSSNIVNGFFMRSGFKSVSVDFNGF